MIYSCCARDLLALSLSTGIFSLSSTPFYTQVQRNLHEAVTEYAKLKQQLEKNMVVINMLQRLQEVSWFCFHMFIMLTGHFAQTCKEGCLHTLVCKRTECTTVPFLNVSAFVVPCSHGGISQDLTREEIRSGSQRTRKGNKNVKSILFILHFLL